MIGVIHNPERGAGNNSFDVTADTPEELLDYKNGLLSLALGGRALGEIEDQDLTSLFLGYLDLDEIGDDAIDTYRNITHNQKWREQRIASLLSGAAAGHITSPLLQEEFRLIEFMGKCEEGVELLTADGLRAYFSDAPATDPVPVVPNLIEIPDLSEYSSEFQKGFAQALALGATHFAFAYKLTRDNDYSHYKFQQVDGYDPDERVFGNIAENGNFEQIIRTPW